MKIKAAVKGRFLIAKIPLRVKPRPFVNAYAGKLLLIADSRKWLETTARLGGKTVYLDFNAAVQQTREK